MDYGRVGGRNPTPGRDDLRFRVLNDNLCSNLTSSLCICEKEENDAQSLRLRLTKVHPGGLARCGICEFEGIGVGIPSETKTRIYSAIKDLWPCRLCLPISLIRLASPPSYLARGFLLSRFGCFPSLLSCGVLILFLGPAFDCAALMKRPRVTPRTKAGKLLHSGERRYKSCHRLN